MSSQLRYQVSWRGKQTTQRLKRPIGNPQVEEYARILESDLYEKDIEISINSRVFEWAASVTPGLWPTNPEWAFPIDCVLKDSLPGLVHKLVNNPVLIVESATGAGKSIFAPAFVSKAIHSMIESGGVSGTGLSTGLKVVHLVRTSEEAYQNAELLRVPLADSAGLFVGNWTSTLGYTGRKLNLLEPGETNYLYATLFYGQHALAGDSFIHALVIDDVHELTPEMVSLMLRAKEKMERGQLLRLVLMSATLSDWLKKTIISYFADSGLSTGVVSEGASPFSCTLMPAGEDPVSQRAFFRKGQSINDKTLFESEQDEEGNPNLSVLRDRAVQLFLEIDQQDNNQEQRVDSSDGVLLIVSSASEAVHTRLSVVMELKKAQRGGADSRDIFTVTGDDRGDLLVLAEKKWISKRIAISTPGLASGVTFHGVDTLIDTGTIKVLGRANRQGVRELLVLWIDGISMVQWRSRVSRLGPGIAFKCYSETRARRMALEDHTIIKLMAKYNNAHVAGLLNESGRLLISPDDDSFSDLVDETGTMGFLRSGPVRALHVDAVGVAFSSALNGLPLDLANFLTICSAFDVLLPGVAIVASMIKGHPATKMPSGTSGPGRDCYDYCLNFWPVFTEGDNTSDMLIYAEILVNLLVHAKAGLDEYPEKWQHLALPKEILDCIISEGVWQIFRNVLGICSGLKGLGVIRDTKRELFSRRRSGLLVREIFEIETGSTYRILQLSEQSAHMFKTACVVAFGHRVLTVAEDRLQTRPNHTLFTLADSSPVSRRFVQGERAHKCPRDSLAVYHTIVPHSKTEDFMTTLFHQCDPLDFLLHGNVYGSAADTVDVFAGQLIIRTNTGSIVYQFEDDEMLVAISKYRRQQRLITGAALLGDYRYTDLMCQNIMDIRSVISSGNIAATRFTE